MKLLHPVMPHVTEEIWSNLPDARDAADRRALARAGREYAETELRLDADPVRGRGISVVPGARRQARATSSGGSSTRSSSPSGSRRTATSGLSASGFARRSLAPRACWRTTASSARPRPRWSRPSARSSPATGGSSMPSATDWVAALSPWPEDGFGLERIRAVLAELGEPQRRYPAIHVVGTNGKSTLTRTVRRDAPRRRGCASARSPRRTSRAGASGSSSTGRRPTSRRPSRACATSASGSARPSSRR